MTTIEELAAQYAAERAERETRRAALVIEVQQAQEDYLAFVIAGKRRTNAAKLAEKRRDDLEEQLIQLDELRQASGDVVPQPAKHRFTRISDEEKQLMAALSQASQARNAPSVGRILRQLEKLWREKDQKPYL